MGYYRTTTVSITGTAATIATVEGTVAASGWANTDTVRMSGMPETAVNQAQTRIRSAMANSSLRFPAKTVSLNLTPAVPFSNGAFADLAVAVTILAAAGTVATDRLAGAVLRAELGLDGSLRTVPGTFPALLEARRAGYTTAIVAPEDADEAALVDGLTVLAPTNLSALVAWLYGQTDLASARPSPDAPPRAVPDMADLRGQPEARRALEIAAAGGHHMFLVGPPAARKTMLAERLSSILPPLTEEESVEVTSQHSLRGRHTGGLAERIQTAPFEAPHHSMTFQALLGGGPNHRPGSLALAHRGVLFINEAPEWRWEVLNSVRQPLESGEVQIRRADATLTYPARFLLVLAANRCPCAADRPGECRCRPGERRRYFDRISRPLRDTCDLRLDVAAPSASQAHTDRPETSATVAARVARARQTAAARWAEAGEQWQRNSEVPGPALRSQRWRLSPQVTRTADRLLRAERITARGYDRILKLAWTVADLHEHDRPDTDDLEMATELRLGYSTAWGSR